MTSLLAGALAPKKRRQTRIGLVAGGLAAYWPQFPDLLPQLQQSSAYVTSRFNALDAEVVDVGFISDAQEANAAAEKLRVTRSDVLASESADGDGTNFVRQIGSLDHRAQILSRARVAGPREHRQTFAAEPGLRPNNKRREHTQAADKRGDVKRELPRLNIEEVAVVVHFHGLASRQMGAVRARGGHPKIKPERSHPDRCGLIGGVDQPPRENTARQVFRRPTRHPPSNLAAFGAK